MMMVKHFDDDDEYDDIYIYIYRQKNYHNYSIKKN